MERSKIKDIVIVLLLLLNLFFLFLNFGQGGEAASQKAIEERVVQILHQQEIAIDPQIVPWKSALESFSQSRVRYDDHVLATGLVGDISREQTGTNWNFYGEYGRVEIFQYGAFEANYDAPYVIAMATEEEGRSFLESLGIHAEADLSRSKAGTYVFWQTQDDLPVFSCEITLFTENGMLAKISGRRLVGPLGSGGDVMRTAATLLTAFSQAKAEERIFCTEILEIQEGYINQGTVPVWRVLTDEGIIYLDCVTGEIRYV